MAIIDFTEVENDAIGIDGRCFSISKKLPNGNECKNMLYEAIEPGVNRAKLCDDGNAIVWFRKKDNVITATRAFYDYTSKKFVSRKTELILPETSDASTYVTAEYIGDYGYMIICSSNTSMEPRHIYDRNGGYLGLVESRKPVATSV